MAEVRLLRLPVPLWARAQEQSEALQREFALAASDPAGVPARLLELVNVLQQQYSAATSRQEEQLLDAVEQGLPELDVSFDVPTDAGQAAQQLGRLLDEADEHCRAGDHLLTLAADEELVRFRWWYLDSFTDQCAGLPPVPWPDYRRA